MAKKKDLSLEDITFPKWVNKCDKPLKVVGKLEDFFPNLKPGLGYIYNDHIWEYSTSTDTKANPIVYYDRTTEELVTLGNINNEVIPVDELLRSSLSLIINNTKGDEKFVDDTEIVQAPSSSAVFIPEIGPKDDFLKKLIKTVFQIKKVPTTKYRKKLSKAYVFSNLFQGLNNETKISTNVWQTWIELIGIDCVIILKDSGSDPDTPIEDFVVYKSRNDSIEIVKRKDILESLKETLDIKSK